MLAARVPDLPQYASMAWTQSQMAENVHLVLLRSPTRDRFLRGFQTVGLSNSGTRAALLPDSWINSCPHLNQAVAVTLAYSGM